MPRLKRSVKARSDLSDILHYSVSTFGDRIGREYVRSFDGVFLRILANPRTGRAVDHLIPGMRRLSHRKHFVFFTQTAGDVLVVRVLHQAMDIEKQFGA